MRYKGHGAYRYIQNSGSKSGGKRPLAHPRRRWEETIKTDVKLIGYENVNRILQA
jgi:hypothetical protein